MPRRVGGRVSSHAMSHRHWVAAVLASCILACAGPRPPATQPPTSVTLTYLGVAGWSLSDGKHTLLVDPYFSRAQDPARARTEEAAVRAHTPPRADLVLVGHDHWDHALDAPLVAQLTGAPLLFAFLVRLGGREVLVLDTANYIERELEGLRPDVAIVVPGGGEKVHDYSCRLLRALGSPPRVLPTHFDDYFKPPETPLDAESQADLTSFAAEVHACSPRTEVTVPRPFVPVTF